MILNGGNFCYYALYNAEKYLNQALDSVLNQTFTLDEMKKDFSKMIG